MMNQGAAQPAARTRLLIGLCLAAASISGCASPDPAYLDLQPLLPAASRAIWLLLAGVILYILPGWGVLGLLIPGWAHRPWEERIALSGGVSLAIYPILFLWTDLLGLHLGTGYAWIPPVSGLLLMGWGWLWERKKTSPVNSKIQDTGITRDASLLRNGVLAALMAASLLTRIWVLRTVDLPMFGDGFQHTVITQLLLDHGGLFESWAPYADLTTFTYHFGFHSAAAAFSWLTQLQTTQSVLWTGQIFNFLAVLAVIPLANRLGKNRWAGVFALMAAGLISPQPFSYTNWGRYTQLAAQIMLPAAAWLVWEISTTLRPGRGLIAGTAFILGGMALTHYRVLIFTLALLPIAIWLGTGRAGLRRNLTSYAWIGLGAGAIFLPWFIQVYGGKVLEIFGYQITTSPADTGTIAAQTNSIGNLFEYLPAIAWMFLPICIGWGLWKKERGVALIAGWWFLVFLLANPQWLDLPGEGALSSFAVLLAMYIPASILTGAAFAWLATIQPLRRISPGWLHASFGAIILAILAWTAPLQPRLIQPQTYSLVTPADLKAAKWIKANTPDTARFLINSFPAFGGFSAAGSDAGWWLPLTAGRATTLPPLNYSFELGDRPDYRTWINSLVEAVLAKGTDHPDVLAMLAQRGVTHVYIGELQGQVNYNGPAFLDPQELGHSPNYRPVYHQDQVWVFEIIQP